MFRLRPPDDTQVIQTERQTDRQSMAEANLRKGQQLFLKKDRLIILKKNNNNNKNSGLVCSFAKDSLYCELSQCVKALRHKWLGHLALWVLLSCRQVFGQFHQKLCLVALL